MKDREYEGVMIIEVFSAAFGLITADMVNFFFYDSLASPSGPRSFSSLAPSACYLIGQRRAVQLPREGPGRAIGGIEVCF